jgi:hypothetical protein
MVYFVNASAKTYTANCIKFKAHYWSVVKGNLHTAFSDTVIAFHYINNNNVGL